VFGKTQREALAKLRRLMQQVEQGRLPTDERRTVAQYLTAWADGVAASVRPSTAAAYRLCVRRLLPLIGHLRLVALTPTDLSRAYHRLLQDGLSPRSVQQTATVLHTALREAERQGLIARNVAALARAPRPEPAERRILSPAELTRLFADSAARGDRLHALWVLLGTTGCRVGEALGARWECLDLAAGTWRIDRALQRQRGAGLVLVPPKSAASRRLVHLPQIAVQALRAHRTRQLEERLAAGPAWQDLLPGLVFTRPDGRPLDPAHVNHRLHAALRTAGLPDVRVHDLRHSVASALLARGVHPKLVQSLLGHSTPLLTLATYSHVTPDLHAATTAHLDALFAASAPTSAPPPPRTGATAAGADAGSGPGPGAPS
jgi:integrase